MLYMYISVYIYTYLHINMYISQLNKEYEIVGDSYNAMKINSIYY